MRGFQPELIGTSWNGDWMHGFIQAPIGPPEAGQMQPVAMGQSEKHLTPEAHPVLKALSLMLYPYPLCGVPPGTLYSVFLAL
jgi:hypothetical protein